MSRIRGYAAALAVCAVVCTAPHLASADDYFGGDAPDGDIHFRMDKPRTAKQRIVLGALFGGALAFGGIGLGFHLHSRSLADDVSAVGDHSRRVYDQSIEDSRKSGLRSGTLATVGYSLGGGFLVAGVVALYLTEPGTKIVTVGQEKDEQAPPAPTIPVSRVWVAPVSGGAMAGTGWRF